MIYTAAPRFLAGTLDPLPKRLDFIPGHETVPVPPPARLKEPDPPRWRFKSQHHSNVSGLLHSVETAPEKHRNLLLYWATRRVAEDPDIDHQTAARDLVRAAVHAGLSEREAAATVRSGLRQRGSNA